MRHPRLHLEEREGVRLLTAGPDRVPQSAVRPGDPSHLEFEYTRLAVAALALVEPSRIAVLGLGAGTLPRFFRWLLPDAEILAVEVDPEVVRVARDEFGLVEDARLRVEVGDAREWLERTDGTWDLVVEDAFLGDVAPPHLSTLEFFRAARARLSLDGALVQNVWGRPNPRFGSVRRTLREAFETVVDLAGEADRNHVFIALADGRPLTREAFVARAREPVGARPLPFDLAAEVDRSWAGLVPRNPPGRVLRDEAPRPKLTSSTRRT